MLRPARFAGPRAVLVPLLLLASFGVSSCLAAATASAASASGATSTLTATPTLAPGPSLEAAANPFGLPRVVSFKVKPATGVTVTLGCAGTSTQPCTGTIFATTAEALHGNKVVAVVSSAAAAKRAKGRHRAIRIAQSSFSLAGGQTATIQLKLNATGLKLLRRFHTISAYVLAGEVLPQGKFIFLVREVLFKTPVKHK